jgi:cytochrome P450
MARTRRETRAAAARAVARRSPPPDHPAPAPSALTQVVRPPGPHGPAVVARLLARTPPNRVFSDVARAHGPVAHIRMAGEHVHLVSDPELVHELFLTRAREVMKGRGLQATRPLLGNGLLTSEGEFHLRQRRLVQPAFHRGRIESYATQMVQEGRRHSADWYDGREVDMVEEMTALTFAIVGRTLFGTDLTGDARSFGETLEELIEGFGSLSAIGNERLVRLLPQGRELLARVEDLDIVVQRIIDEHREGIAAGTAPEDLLTWMMQARDDQETTYGAAMTDEQLRDEVMTLVLAGHETTAMALSWTWWLLSSHPALDAWLQEELREVLGAGAALRDPSYADLAVLHRTRAVVAESIRLYPPAWIMGRRLLTDLTIGDWQVPSGSIVLASPWILHRDPAVWDRATSFVPQRWLGQDGRFEESVPGAPRGSWVPFGFGNRRCIGEQFAWTEATLLVAQLASRWRPELVPGSRVDTRAAITLRPAYGLPMTLHAR